MMEGAFYQPKRTNRTALAVVLLMHGAALTALAMAKGEVIVKAFGTTKTFDVPIDEPPPPEPVTTVEPPVTTPKTVITHVPPIVESPIRDSLVTTDPLPPIEQIVISKPAETIVPKADPPKIEVRTVKPARARANLASYVSDEDYPSVAIRNEEQGTTRFQLAVGPDGKVKECRVTGSSGSSALDSATCKLMKARRPVHARPEQPGRADRRYLCQRDPLAAAGRLAPAIGRGWRGRGEAPILGAMPLPRPASPRALWADHSHLHLGAPPAPLGRRRARHRSCRSRSSSCSSLDGRTNILPGPQLIYVESWPADRSDEEIKAQQKIDQAARDKAHKERQEMFKQPRRAIGAARPLTPDERWMGAAVALGERGRGDTAPNPNVGCVIVKDDAVVGRGWTQPGGRPHAEAMALAEAGEAARGATVYVTLEPCCHRSERGPACADLIRRGGRGPGGGRARGSGRTNGGRRLRAAAERRESRSRRDRGRKARPGRWPAS